MKKFILPLLVLFACVSGVPYANATLITFEDITPYQSAVIHNGYKGLNWGNFKVLNTKKNPWAGSGYGKASNGSSYVAYNARAKDATISGDLFNFNSAAFSAAWNKKLRVTVTGLNNGEKLYRKTFKVSPSQRKVVTFDFFGIDQLIFRTFGGRDFRANDGGKGRHLALDNLKFNLVAQSPEPSTLLLMGIALIGLIIMRRRMQRA